MPAFSPKSNWRPAEGHPNLEVFLRQIEREFFKMVETPLGYSSLFKEVWKSVRTLVHDCSIVIKKADEGFCVVIWDTNEYIAEAESPLKNEVVYKKYPKSSTYGMI